MSTLNHLLCPGISLFTARTNKTETREITLFHHKVYSSHTMLTMVNECSLVLACSGYEHLPETEINKPSPLNPDNVQIYISSDDCTLV